MNERREILTLFPGGKAGLVLRQERVSPDAIWCNMGQRAATPEEIKTGKVIQTEPPTPMPAKPKATPPAPPAPQVTQPEPPPPVDDEKLSGSHNNHARLSPSSSKQWINCTGSIALIEANRHRVPADTGSVYADEGTEAHDWAAKRLTGKIGADGVPEKFRPHVEAYVEHCKVVTPPGATVLVEQQVPLFYQPKEKGTCDYVAITNERIVVRDLKYGAGVLVESFENTQLAIYALSVIRLMDMGEFGPDTVVDIAVFQPRHHEGADQHPWVLTLAELEQFCREIEYRATQAKVGLERAAAKIEGFGSRDIAPAEIREAAPGVEFAPGEGDDGACRWCPAKAFCPARAAAVVEPIDNGFYVRDAMAMMAAMPMLDKEESKQPALERVKARTPEPEITDGFLVAVYRSSKAIKAWLADIEEYLGQRAERGQAAPGTKLVLGREGNREWTDEEAADKWLAGQKLKVDERYKFTLKSPAQIEALLKEKLAASARTANKFQSLITRSEARKVLALEDDKRPAVGAAVAGLPDMDKIEEFEV